MSAEAENRDDMPPELAARAEAMRGWLVCEARFIDDPNVVTQSFAERVLDAGVPLDRLALSPQCGFASIDVGNLVSVDEEVRKLTHVIEIARDVWGDA